MDYLPLNITTPPQGIRLRGNTQLTAALAEAFCAAMPPVVTAKAAEAFGAQEAPLAWRNWRM